MASITPAIGWSPADNAPVVQRVPNVLRLRALAVLITGCDRPGDPGVQRFLDYAHDQKLSLEELWMAGPQGEGADLLRSFGELERVLGVALAVPSPGKTAMLFVPPDEAGQRTNATAAAARAAGDASISGGTSIVQALLDVDQLHEREALEAAGLYRLARLDYLQCNITGRHLTRRTFGVDRLIDRVPPESVAVTHYSPDTHELFGRAVEASYIDTLDCPGLLGHRNIDEVLAGHRATGLFNPQLWFVITVDEEPAGVLLLARVQQDESFELVYLGVSPQYRGRGLGERLVDHALRLTASAGARRLMLAVDDQNHPAIKLYRKKGFQAVGMKTAMVRMRQQPLR